MQVCLFFPFWITLYVTHLETLWGPQELVCRQGNTKQRERRALYMYAAQLSGCAPKGPTGASFIHSDRNKTGVQICLLPVQWHGETFWFKKKTFRGYTIQKKSNISYCKSLIRSVSSFPALLAFRVQEKAELLGDHSAGESICELKMLLFSEIDWALV